MNLRKKTLLILFLTLAGLIGGAFLVSSRILLSKFEATDAREAEERVARARDLVLEALAVLRSKTGDWANWDETYAYMADQNPGFIRANVTDKSFTEIKVNVMLFVAPSKHVISGQAFDLARKARRPMLDGLEAHLGATSPLLDHPDENSAKTGLLLLPEGPLLVAARPILTGEGKGPPRGTLIFGRLLDDAELQRLSELLHYPLAVHRLDNPALTKDLGGGWPDLLRGKPLAVRPIDAHSIAGYTLLSDIHGRPAIILRVVGPRLTYSESRSSLTYLLISLVVVGLGFAGVSLVLLEACVLSRLARLTTDVQGIGAGGGREARVQVAGSDELARLAATVNAMLDAQIRMRRQLETVGSVNQEITRELELHALLGLIVRRTTDLVEGGNGSIWLWDEATRTLVLATDVPHETPGARMQLGEGLAGVVAERREGLCVNDFRNWPHARPQTLDRTRISAAIGEPLLYRDRLIGVLAVDNAKTGRPFGEEAQHVLRLFAPQAAIAIENARLHTAALHRSTELAVRTRHLEAVRIVSEKILHELDLTRLLQLIMQGAVDLVGAHRGSIRLWDEAEHVLIPRAWTDSETGRVVPSFRLGEGVAGTAALRRQGLIVNDLASSPYALHLSTLGSLNAAVLAEPLVYRDRLVGVIGITLDHPARAFTEDDQRLVQLFAAHAAIAIEHAHLYDTALRRGNQLAALLESTQSLMTDLDLRGVLTRIVTAASAIGESPLVKISLYDADRATLRVESETGTGTPVGTVMPVEGTLSGLAVRERQPIFSADCGRDARNAYAARDQALGLVTSLNLPIVYRDTVLGVVSFNTKTARVYPPSDLAVLQAFAAQAGIAIEHARLFAAAQQAVDSLKRAQAELVRSETLRGLGQMAAGIAHDLNNTLATILGQVELQKLRTLEPSGREGLALLETAALDGAQTVQRLLQFARPRGTSPLEPIDLAAVVREVVEITSPRWKDEPQRHGLTIHLVLDFSELPKIVGNPPELRELVTNLIFNAVDAMPHGGTLTLRGRLVDSSSRQFGEGTAQPFQSTSRPVDQSTSWVQLSVCDTGMPPEIQARVFEPFFTTKGVRGTGLGLASVYGIVERFGGRIALTSAVGQGTTVTLTFRRTVEAPPVESAARAPSCGHRRRVLVVDDEPTVRKTVAALLDAMGHQVTEAADGPAAIRILAETAQDLVVTDLGMPDMNGWEVARAVKAANAALPVVLLTGWQDTTASTEDERQAVDRILGKPVRLDTLQRIIAELTATPPAVPS